MNEVQEETEYSFNQVLRWPTDRSKDWTRTFVLSAQRDSTIVAIVAIGSAVRPSVPSIDLDLLALCAGSNSIDESPPIEVDLPKQLRNVVDSRLAESLDRLLVSETLDLDEIDKLVDFAYQKNLSE